VVTVVKKERNFWLEMTSFFETHLRRLGITEDKLLGYVLETPRERFLPSKYMDHAYDNIPIPLGYNRMAFQPHLVAMMIDAAQLQSTDNVLEIGTGCGYSTAILSKLSNSVYSLEWVEELYEESCCRMQDMGVTNVSIHHTDIHQGCSQHAPYDAIVLGITTSMVPDLLYEQLALNGRMVIPMIDDEGKTGNLIRITRTSPSCYEEELIVNLYNSQHIDPIDYDEDAYW